jgi:anti-sigma factor RsiW
MAEIIRFQGDSHRQTQTLLPWYANGSLEPEETAQVEAHLVECADCRADLKLEQALCISVAALPDDMEQGWSKLRDRVQGRSEPGPRPTPRTAAFLGRGLPAVWVLTAQAASLAVIAGLAWIALFPARPSATYRVLGSAPVAAAGNVVVVFRPTTTERDLRAALVGEAARIVDGPTASDAYVLQVAAATRGAALARLRANSHVLLAEPIDADGRP